MGLFSEMFGSMKNVFEYVSESIKGVYASGVGIFLSMAEERYQANLELTLDKIEKKLKKFSDLFFIKLRLHFFIFIAICGTYVSLTLMTQKLFNLDLAMSLLATSLLYFVIAYIYYNEAIKIREADLDD